MKPCYQILKWNSLKVTYAFVLPIIFAFNCLWAQYKFPEQVRTKPRVYVSFGGFNPSDFSQFEAELKKRTEALNWEYVVERQPGNGSDSRNIGAQNSNQHKWRIYKNVDMMINIAKPSNGPADKYSNWFLLFNDIPTLYAAPPIRIGYEGMLHIGGQRISKGTYEWFFDDKNPHAQNDHPLWKGLPKDKPFPIVAPGIHWLCEENFINSIAKGERAPYVFGPLTLQKSNNYHQQGRCESDGGTRLFFTFGIEKGTTTAMMGDIPLKAKARRVSTFPPSNSANEWTHHLFWNAFEWVAKEVTLRSHSLPKGPGDANGDGKVDAQDLDIISKSYGRNFGNLNFNPQADLTEKEGVSSFDIWQVIQNMGNEY